MWGKRERARRETSHNDIYNRQIKGGPRNTTNKDFKIKIIIYFSMKSLHKHYLDYKRIISRCQILDNLRLTTSIATALQKITTKLAAKGKENKILPLPLILYDNHKH